MVYRSLLVSFALLILFALFRPFYPERQYLTIWQDNVVKTQRYRFETPARVKNVLVGSSLSSKLVMDSLPDFFNLSFRGLSLFNGLEVIQSKAEQPARVFIEINYVLREESAGFTSSVRSPVVQALLEHLPFLREEYKPAVMLVTCVANGLPAKWSRPRPRGPRSGKTDQKLFYMQLARHISENSKRPDSRILSGSFTKLRNKVEELERKGVKVIFFEMPVDSRLYNLPATRAIRQYCEYYFPADKYSFIKAGNNGEYFTRDGIHLDARSAAQYTSFFKGMIR